MSLPQAAVNSFVDGILFTPDGPVRSSGFVVTGAPQVIVSPIGTPAAVLGSLCIVSGAAPLVITASGTVFHTGIQAATETDIVAAPNYIGSIVSAGQGQVITRR